MSTLWLADAAWEVGGHVLSFDIDPQAQHDARETVRQAGLADYVEFRLEDGGSGLASIDTGEVDLLFLDAEPTEYPSCWPHPVRALRQGGVLVADNALADPEEIAPLHALLDRDPLIAVTTIGVGKGELVVLRR